MSNQLLLFMLSLSTTIALPCSYLPKALEIRNIFIDSLDTLVDNIYMSTDTSERKIWTCNDSCPLLITFNQDDAYTTSVMRLKQFEYNNKQFFVSFGPPFLVSQNDNAHLILNEDRSFIPISYDAGKMFIGDLMSGNITFRLDMDIHSKFIHNTLYVVHSLQSTLIKMQNHRFYLETSSSPEAVLYSHLTYQNRNALY